MFDIKVKAMCFDAITLPEEITLVILQDEEQKEQWLEAVKKALAPMSTWCTVLMNGKVVFDTASELVPFVFGDRTIGLRANRIYWMPERKPTESEEKILMGIIQEVGVGEPFEN